ncbi:MAG TPA: VWA domain-containing protein [Candidatus Binatia bacterium]|nr:VWA domain-containing protein [Candidatus Binatia bacterium]
MGGGHYDREAHEEATTTRAALPVERVFTQTKLHKDMNPFGVTVRESRDSAAHPNSIGIMFFLDETGSMGHIPPFLARDKKGLASFMGMLIDGAFVEDPQVFFGAIGDAVQQNREESPLQVGQFESEAHLMDKWLTAIHLEKDGGGNNGESYDMAFYFAARHTAMDCWEKRGRKGYLFITGDEPPLRCVNAQAVRDRCGDDLRKDIPVGDIIEEASKTFHAFYLIPDQQRAMRCERPWRDKMGDHVIVLETHEDTSAVAATLIGLTEGTLADLDAVGATLKRIGLESGQINRIIRTVEAYAASIGRGGEGRPVEGGAKKRGRK